MGTRLNWDRAKFIPFYHHKIDSDSANDKYPQSIKELFKEIVKCELCINLRKLGKHELCYDHEKILEKEK